MKIVEKLSQGSLLTVKEQEQQRILFLEKLADLKVILQSLPEAKKIQASKLLSLLLLYYPENWKVVLFKRLHPVVLDNLIKEESGVE